MLSVSSVWYCFIRIMWSFPGRIGNWWRIKNLLPGGHPSGRGLSRREKEEQAGREPEVSAVDLRSLQRQYPGVRGWLTIPEVGIGTSVMQSSREVGSCVRRLRGNYDINGSLFLQANCILGESKNLTIYGHNMNSGAMSAIWTGTPPMITGKHIPGCSFRRRKAWKSTG